MKKLIYVSIATLAIISCKKQMKDYVIFSGKITNPHSNSLTISNQQIGYKKTITIDENGVFEDTLKVKSGFYSVFDGKEYTSLYLQNGNDIKMTLDTKQFDETISYSGKGAKENNFLAKTVLSQEKFFMDKELFSLSKTEFDTKVNNFVDEFTKELTNEKFAPSFVAAQKENIEGLKNFLTQKYKEDTYIRETLAKGLASPKFTDYENHKGGTTSLDDLKGKYVYIDLWATWCQPCKAEIPFMKKVEEKYHGKNIEFVGISFDEPRDYETWKQMVNDLKMGGIQLYAKGDKSFGQAYRVSGIPRFILIDPNGNIVDANAPRPSDPRLVELLNSLKI